MFDLGRTFLAVVERSPGATAITDGERRLGYASWYQEIGRVADGSPLRQRNTIDHNGG